MKVNKLLQTQIKRFLPEGSLDKEQMVDFIKAISNTYNLYQKEVSALAEYHPTTVSNSEATVVQPEEVDLPIFAGAAKPLPVPMPGTVESGGYSEKIPATITNPGDHFTTAATRLSYLFDNLNNGILLVDENRKIILANEYYNDSFKLSLSSLDLVGKDFDFVAQESKHLFKDPYEFVTRIDLLLAAKKIATGDELELIDGRILLRDYIPLFINDEHKGHLWKFEDITREKENQKTLQRLSLVASANENGVAFSDATGEMIWINEGFSKLTGYSYEEAIGRNAFQLCAGPLSDRGSLAQIADCFLAGKSFLLEVIHYRKDKSWFWGRIKGQSIRDEKGNITQYFAMIEDISLEKEQEEQLRVLSLIAEENINAVIIMDVLGCITWVNKSFINKTGFTLEDVQGKLPGAILDGPETDTRVLKRFTKAMQAGQPFNCELVNYTKTGNKLWVRIQSQPLRNKQGILSGFFSLEEDITEEVEHKKMLKDYESRFRKAFEKIGDNVWEHDFLTGETYFSNTKSHLLGYESSEFLHNKNLWWDRTHKDDAQMMWDNNALYKKGDIDHHNLEYRVLHKDGSIRWVMDRGVVIQKDENDNPLKLIGTHTDITERKQAEELLQTKEEKYRSIIANMNLGLMEVDTEETILYTNQSFCDMSGYDYEELIGKRASHIFTKGENIELIESKNEARKKINSDAYEIAVKNKRGQLRWWLMSGATRYSESGELVGSIGIYLDITDQKQLEIDLIEAREQAEGSTRSKEVFLANMSHEIRTPMNAILGMAQQLAKTKLDSRQLFYLDTINSASENLLVIINDILDLSKIEAGKLNLENIGFEPTAVISRATQVLMHKAEEKGLSITNSKSDARLWPVLMGDPYRLNQVLLNLISNAIKFTEKGGVDLSCTVLKESAASQTVFVEVKDTGIGMDKEFVKNLFENFSQEDVSITRQYGGTGLGMSICKDLIELMGGEIMVESTKGVGTTISFVVEFAKGTVTDLPSRQNVYINNDVLAHKKILVVDDNNMNRLVAKTILNNFGVITTEAANGKEAVEQLKASVVDLVLMDIQMPVMDGIEATKVIRREISNSLPLIALTANAIKGDNEKCIAAGMNAYVSKPFKEEDLLKAVAFWLSETQSIQRSTANVKRPKRYDLSAIRSISRGNEGFVVKMVGMFIEQTPRQILEMEQRFHEGDYKSMGAIAHKIKPSIDNLGIVSLKDPIREIEQIGKSGQVPEHLETLLQSVSIGLSDVIIALQEELVVNV